MSYQLGLSNIKLGLLYQSFAFRQIEKVRIKIKNFLTAKICSEQKNSEYF